MKNRMKSRLIEAGISVFVIGVVALPFFGFAKGGREIYVDDGASGTQDGSSSHPYETIWQAIDKATDGDKIYVAKGTYKENITIPKGVSVIGAGKGKTTIKSDDRDQPVVNMKDRTKLWGVTVKNGQSGIYIREDARAEVSDSEVVDNRHEGILIDSGERNDHEKVSITDTDITENGWSGIYSKERKVVLVDCSIKSNDKNGIVFESGVRAWLEGNSIGKNAGSGLVANLDKADITVAKKNTFRENGRSGVEVNSYGTTGTIDIKKSRFVNNTSYGVARLSKVANISSSLWGGLVTEGNNVFAGNGRGNTSSIIRGF